MIELEGVERVPRLSLTSAPPCQHRRQKKQEIDTAQLNPRTGDNKAGKLEGKTPKNTYQNDVKILEKMDENGCSMNQLQQTTNAQRDSTSKKRPQRHKANKKTHIEAQKTQTREKANMKTHTEAHKRKGQYENTQGNLEKIETSNHVY